MPWGLKRFQQSRITHFVNFLLLPITKLQAGQRVSGEVWFGKHWASNTGSQINFMHADWLSAGRLWTDLNGNVTLQCETSPYADMLYCSGSGNNFDDVFAGLKFNFDDFQFDSQTRQYNGSQGRWTVPDPAGLASVDRTNPQTWNRYAYVRNNPLSNVDPSGLDDISAAGAPWNGPGMYGNGGWGAIGAPDYTSQFGPGDLFGIAPSLLPSALGQQEASLEAAFDSQAAACAFGQCKYPSPAGATAPAPWSQASPSSNVWVSGGCTSWAYSNVFGGESGNFGCGNGAFISFDAWVQNWQQYPQEYQNGVAYLIAFRSGLSPEDVRIQRLAAQITEQIDQPMTPCEYAVDAPAAMAIVAGPWVEGPLAYGVYGTGAAGTLAAWSICK